MTSTIRYFIFFFFQCSRDTRDLHSFPTRRSSDLIVERVFNSCETRAHASLDDHNGARLVHVKNRHAKNRARCIRARSRIGDRKSTRLNSSHITISYAVFCLKKKKNKKKNQKIKRT